MPRRFEQIKQVFEEVFEIVASGLLYSADWMGIFTGILQFRRGAASIDERRKKLRLSGRRLG
jgi:hypothetical protein